MWVIWRQRNGLVFNTLHWLLENTHEVVWDSLIGCSRLNGNGLSTTWRKLQALPIKMYVESMIWFGMSKVLLLLVAIYWLHGRLGLRWALFHDVSLGCIGSPS